MKKKITVFIAAICAVTLLLPSQLFCLAAGDDPIKLPVIMYHLVEDKHLGKDVISTQEFESDLKYLAENNYTTVTIRDVVDYIYDGRPLPEKPIILTFDDGYVNTYRVVFPIIKKYHVKIVVSVIGKAVDDFSLHPSNSEFAHATWAQLVEMTRSGCVELQNHTYNMHANGSPRIGCEQKAGETFEKYEHIMAEDVINCQQSIYQWTGAVPCAFTYPYGRYNENTDKILKSLGFKATLTCNFGINRLYAGDPDCLYDLKRPCRSHNYSLEKLVAEIDKL